MSRGCISLPITFGMPENFRTESALFDAAELNLPFNAILDRLTLYQFMVVAHYRYLVLSMPSPNSVLKIRGDRDVGISALEKLQALAAACETATGLGGTDPAPSSSCQCGSTSTSLVQPSGNEDVLAKVVRIRTDATQTTRITGDIDSK
jgi:hypothetical protein